MEISHIRIVILTTALVAVLAVGTAAAENASANPCEYPMTPECDNWDLWEETNSTKLNTSTDPHTLEKRKYGIPCLTPITPACHDWDERKNSSEYKLNTSTNPNTLEYDYSTSLICSTELGAQFANKVAQGVYIAFAPLALIGLMSARGSNALPWLSQSRRRRLMRWRKKILSSAFGLYILLPIARHAVDDAGVPIADCVSLLPF